MAARARLAVSLCAAVCVPVAALAQPPLTLAGLETMALDHHPALAEADAGIAAADARVSQAGRWPNPSIGYTAEEVSGSATIRWGEHGVFVEQVFPISGRLGADRAVRAREADEMRAGREDRRMRVLNGVRLRYRQALIAAARVAVREELAQHAREGVAATRQLANIGAADEVDVLVAEADAARARAAADYARHEQSSAWRQLAQAVGVPALPAAALAGDPEAAPPPLAYEMALATLLSDSPELRLAAAGVARAEALLVRAGKETKPDLVVRAGPRYNRELLDPGPAPVGWEAFADVGVSVPLWNRNRGGVAAAEAEVARAREAVARVELDLRSRLTELFRQYASARGDIRAYRDEIAPRLEAAFRLRRERYEERRAEYVDVLAAQRSVLELREGHLDVLQRGWRAALLIDGLLVGADPSGAAFERRAGY